MKNIGKYYVFTLRICLRNYKFAKTLIAAFFPRTDRYAPAYRNSHLSLVYRVFPFEYFLLWWIFR